MSQFQVVELGLKGYEAALQIQRETIEKVIRGEAPDTLLLVEHPPVLTLGANYHLENLLHPEDWYIQQGIEIVQTDRGGDITYHGPGQLVAYPIFSLENQGRDLHRWLRQMEEAVIQTLRTLGLDAHRFPPHTGVWVEDRKICAIGIKVKKWVSMHGLALNCNLDLSPFKWIVPCGIQEYGVTSLSEELNREIKPKEISNEFVEAFKRVFNLEPS